MNKKLILALDLGTQSARAIIIDTEGSIIAKAKREYKPVYLPLEEGRCEQYPDTYFDYLCSATQELNNLYPQELKSIIGVVLTTFRDTAVFLDENYKVLRPSILWLDQRVSQYRPKVPLWKQALFAIVGMTPVVKNNQQKTMAHWVKANQPDLWNKTKKYVNISTYFNYLLTGQLKDTAANVVGHYPLDYKKRDWYGFFELKKNVFDIPKSTYCELVEPGAIIGYITKNISLKTGIPEGIPLYGSGSDKSCESLGNGCIDSSSASISYGTASTITITSKKYIEPSPFLPAYSAVQKDKFNSELQIYRGYWMLNWFKDEFCEKETLEASIQNKAALDILNQKMLAIGPGSDGLILQPYWGPSLERPNSRGAIIGFSEKHTRIHLYRAIIEGIAFCLREGKEKIAKKAGVVKELVVSGGGSVSNAICQITADIFGLPVKKVHTFETSSLGAAMSGFISAGIYKNDAEAKEKMVHYKQVFMPIKENHEKYNYLFNKIYKKAYKRIKPLSLHLREFTGERL